MTGRAHLAVRLVGGLLFLVTLAGCGGSSTASPRPTDAPGTDGAVTPVRVTLGLYSGRADPAWTLTDAEAVALEAALAALPSVAGVPPEAGLGYHGFTIDRPGGIIIAYRGAVAPPGVRASAYLADPARTIERFLAGTARPHITGNELAEVERSFAAP